MPDDPAPHPPVPPPVPAFEAEPARDRDDFDVAVLERVEAELRGVEPALRAIEDGTYGTCSTCGMSISDEVLDEFPTGQCTERFQLPGCPRLRLPIDAGGSAGAPVSPVAGRSAAGPGDPPAG